MNIDEYISQIDKELEDRLSQLNDSINDRLGLISDEEVTNIDAPTESITESVAPASNATNGCKQYYLLRIGINQEKYYQISPVPSIADLRECFAEELDDAGIDDGEITADNLSDIINAYDGPENFGRENCNDIGHYTTSLEFVDLIKAEEDEEWWQTSRRQEDATYDPCEVDFEPGEMDILEEGITITGLQPTCRNCFVLCLEEDEEFNPKNLSIRNSNPYKSMIVCEYDGVPLKFECMGCGDEDLDYYEDIHIYLNGEEIDYEENYE